jgi:4-hydroxythreonine-4-phosphate dehydrogenase
MLAQKPPTEHLVVIANRELLEQRARMMGLPWRSLAFNPAAQPAVARGALPVIDVPLAAAVTAGRLARVNAAYVLRTLEVAVDGCMDGHFHAMVTAPVHKGIINDAGTAFTGHTEYLAQRTHTPHVVMMLVGGGLRVAAPTLSS